MSQVFSNNINNRINEINLREEAEKYLRYWPWFVLAIILALTLAFLILRYTTPIYSTSATIIIKDGKNSQNSEMAAFAELGLLNGMNSNSIQNEIGLLQSRRIMEEVVKTLDLNVIYQDVSALRSPELYKNSPYIIKILSQTPATGGQFLINGMENNNLNLSDPATEKEFTAQPGKPVDLGFATVVIRLNELELPGNLEKEQILVKIQPVEKIASNYRNALNVSVKESNSSLVELSLNDPLREKAQDILDQLVLEYNKEAIEDKNLVAMNTAEFIDDRLVIINEELDSVETGKVQFKERNKLTDIQAESQLFMDNASEFKRRQQELDTQIELANAMLEYLNNSNGTELLPANLGIEESGVNSLISEYNQLVLERNRILSGSTERNPVVIKLNSQIQQLKANVLESLNNLKSNLQIAENNLNREAASIGSRIAAVPSKENNSEVLSVSNKLKKHYTYSYSRRGKRIL